MASLEHWRLINSKPLVSDRWLQLSANTYQTPDGHIIEPYYVIESLDWVNCFVIDANYNVVLVRHYRPAVDSYLLELVSGGVEPNDSSPEAGILRELREEIGYQGGTLHHVGATFPNPARQTNTVHSFLAVGGQLDLTPSHEIGESMQLVQVPFKQFLLQLNQSVLEVRQSMYLATIFLSLEFMRRADDPAMKKFSSYFEK